MNMCDVAQRLEDMGRMKAYCEMVQEGICPIRVATQKPQISIEEFERRMENGDYIISKNS